MSEKSFVVRKRLENQFTHLSNEMLGDERLSWKARGLLCYMLSKPNDWVFYESELVNHSQKDGLSSLRSAMKELRECGYVKKERVVDAETKRVIRWETYVSMSPDFEEESQIAKSQMSKIENLENRTLQSTDINKELINTNNNPPQESVIGRSTGLKEFLEHYNALDNLPKYNDMSTKRENAIKSLIKKKGLDNVLEYLTSMNERPWLVSSKEMKMKYLKFDLMIREQTYTNWKDGMYMEYINGYKPLTNPSQNNGYGQNAWNGNTNINEHERATGAPSNIYQGFKMWTEE